MTGAKPRLDQALVEAVPGHDGVRPVERGRVARRRVMTDLARGLPHVYAKLGIASRVQLVQEAARNA